MANKKYQSLGPLSSWRRCILQSPPGSHRLSISHTETQEAGGTAVCLAARAQVGCVRLGYLRQRGIEQFTRLVAAGGERQTFSLPRLHSDTTFRVKVRLLLPNKTDSHV